MQRQEGRKGRVQSQHEWDAVTKNSEGVFMKAPLPCPWGPGWIIRLLYAAVRHEASSCHLVTISPRALNSTVQLHQRPLAYHTCFSFCQECFLPYSLPTAFASRVRPACLPADSV